ncbi:hypothetical protein FB565_008202 [Actinoplanes lutulentus]|nr:hypothetical protein [Actinoplanes lutulentus]MBB2948419.1 hypothetical protein [Actinoplanes lutulentus]
MMMFLRYLIHAMFHGPVPDPPEFTDDLPLTDETEREARNRAVRGDWHAAEKLLADAGTDWEKRGRRVQLLADAAAKDGSWLQTWLETAPDDPGAVLVQSETLQIRAARARGSASASETTPEQFHAFHRQSGLAGAAADRAIALALPGDPVPYARKIRTMFGNQAARSSLDEIYAEGRRRDPHNFALHLTAVMLLCEKWYGSHERMFATARDAATAAPPGSKTVLLPLFAHYEYALREFNWDATTTKGFKTARAYFRGPEVRQEMDAWVQKWGGGDRDRECLHWVALHHVLAGRRAEAKALFDEIGPVVDASVAWYYVYGGGAELGYLHGWLWANRLGR